MQNSNNFKLMYEAINEARYILVLTHKNPDADTISCALSLSAYFSENKINHKVYNISKKLPPNLDFLPNYSKITDQIPKSFDLVIYVDCADEYRVGIDIDKSIKSICVDHHQSNTGFCDINIIDDQKGSTAELLYGFFEHNNIQISKSVATALYVGIYDDSIAFTTPRTNTRTFEVLNRLLETGINPSQITDKFLKRDSLAKYRLLPKVLDSLELHYEGEVASIYLESVWLKQTGAVPAEADPAIDMILNIARVNIVFFIRIIESKARVSLRSKGDIDVSKIASNFDGGGHKNAAGLTIDLDDIEEVKVKLLDVIKNYI